MEAKKSIEKFKSDFLRTRSVNQSINPLINVFDGYNRDWQFLIEVTGFFDGFLKQLDGLEITSEKTGPNNTVELVVTAYIAKTYLRLLGKKPSTAKGNKKDVNGETVIDTTPFDRICNLVEKTWCIDIAVSTRKNAIDIFPSWYN